MMYSKLLFDVDNTLLDFNACEKKAIALSLSEVNINPSEEIIDLYSSVNDRYWKKFENGLIEKSDIYVGRFKEFLSLIDAKADAQKLSDIYRKNLSLFADKIDGTDDVLNYLSTGYDIYYITNGMSETQEIRISISGIDKYAKGVFVSEAVGVGKPSELYFDYVLKSIGALSRREVLIIGDSMSSDILGGKNSGIDTCWYNPKREKAIYDTEFVIYSLYDLKKFL